MQDEAVFLREVLDYGLDYARGGARHVGLMQRLLGFGISRFQSRKQRDRFIRLAEQALSTPSPQALAFNELRNALAKWELARTQVGRDTDNADRELMDAIHGLRETLALY